MSCLARPCPLDRCEDLLGISTKEPYTTRKEPYTSTKEPYESAREPYESAKELSSLPVPSRLL